MPIAAITQRHPCLKKTQKLKHQLRSKLLHMRWKLKRMGLESQMRSQMRNPLLRSKLLHMKWKLKQKRQRNQKQLQRRLLLHPVEFTLLLPQTSHHLVRGSRDMMPIAAITQRQIYLELGVSLD